MYFNSIKYMSYIFIFVFLITSCSNSNVTNPIVEKYEYKHSKTEAKEKAEALLEQTITILLETVIKQTITSSENYFLIKSNSSPTVYHTNNSFFWDGDITASPFGDIDSYKANYLSKLSFIDKNGKSAIDPRLSDTTESNFSVNTSLGFTKNNHYGDEIEYNVLTSLSQVTATKFYINSNSLYKRHWIGIYDGNNSDLQFTVNIETKNLYSIFNVEKNISWFSGKLYINMGQYRFIVNLRNSSSTLIEFYRDGKFIESYSYNIESYNMFNKLLALNDIIFPGSTLVNNGFSNLLGKLHNDNEEFDEGN